MKILILSSMIFSISFIFCNAIEIPEHLHGLWQGHVDMNDTNKIVELLIAGIPTRNNTKLVKEINQVKYYDFYAWLDTNGYSEWLIKADNEDTYSFSPLSCSLSSLSGDSISIRSRGVFEIVVSRFDTNNTKDIRFEIGYVQKVKIKKCKMHKATDTEDNNLKYFNKLITDSTGLFRPDRANFPRQWIKIEKPGFSNDTYQITDEFYIDFFLNISLGLIATTRDTNGKRVYSMNYLMHSPLILGSALDVLISELSGKYSDTFFKGACVVTYSSLMILTLLSSNAPAPYLGIDIPFHFGNHRLALFGKFHADMYAGIGIQNEIRGGLKYHYKNYYGLEVFYGWYKGRNIGYSGYAFGIGLILPISKNYLFDFNGAL